MPIPVILDTDIGSDVDDTWALAMLLRCPELEPKLVLTGTADTTYRARVAAKLLEVAGRTDIPVGYGRPQGKGAEFQEPWVRGYELIDYPGIIYDDGVGAMIDIIMEASEPVTIIEIGPPTNLGIALKRKPAIAARCRCVYMGGSIDKGYGDSGPVAETNVRMDVGAALALFGAPWQELLVTPLDTCDLAILEGERYQRLLQSDDPVVKAVIENFRVWSKLVDWMTVDFVDTRSSTLFDTVAIYMAYAADFLEYETVRFDVTAEGKTVRDPEGAFEAQMALRWRDLDGFLDHLTDRLLGN